MQSIATSSTKLLRQEISRKPETPISPWRAGTARHANRDCREKSELSPENRDRRSRAPPPPPAEGATSLLLRRLRGRLLKRTSPDGH